MCYHHWEQWQCQDWRVWKIEHCPKKQAGTCLGISWEHKMNNIHESPCWRCRKYGSRRQRRKALHCPDSYLIEQIGFQDGRQPEIVKHDDQLTVVDTAQYQAFPTNSSGGTQALYGCTQSGSYDAFLGDQQISTMQQERETMQQYPFEEDLFNQHEMQFEQYPFEGDLIDQQKMQFDQQYPFEGNSFGQQQMQFEQQQQRFDRGDEVKKQARKKKRTHAPFTNQDDAILHNIITDYDRTSGVLTRDWKEVTREYNQQCGTSLTAPQIRSRAGYMKVRARKDNTTDHREQFQEPAADQGEGAEEPTPEEGIQRTWFSDEDDAVLRDILATLDGRSGVLLRDWKGVARQYNQRCGTDLSAIQIHRHAMYLYEQAEDDEEDTANQRLQSKHPSVDRGDGAEISGLVKRGKRNVFTGDDDALLRDVVAEFNRTSGVVKVNWKEVARRFNWQRETNLTADQIKRHMARLKQKADKGKDRTTDQQQQFEQDDHRFQEELQQDQQLQQTSQHELQWSNSPQQKDQQQATDLDARQAAARNAARGNVAEKARFGNDDDVFLQALVEQCNRTGGASRTRWEDVAAQYNLQRDTGYTAEQIRRHHTYLKDKAVGKR